MASDSPTTNLGAQEEPTTPPSASPEPQPLVTPTTCINRPMNPTPGNPNNYAVVETPTAIKDSDGRVTVIPDASSSSPSSSDFSLNAITARIRPIMTPAGTKSPFSSGQSSPVENWDHAIPTPGSYDAPVDETPDSFQVGSDTGTVQRHRRVSGVQSPILLHPTVYQPPAEEESLLPYHENGYYGSFPQFEYDRRRVHRFSIWDRFSQCQMLVIIAIMIIFVLVLIWVLAEIIKRR